ncbi:membrane protein [Gordonia phage LittleFella]|nr:membrane protein [Gordonia phage LittleFella]
MFAAIFFFVLGLVFTMAMSYYLAGPLGMSDKQALKDGVKGYLRGYAATVAVIKAIGLLAKTVK